MKRGLPLYFPVRKNLRRVEKLLRNMSAVAEIQSAIALIRRHRHGTRDRTDGEWELGTEEGLKGTAHATPDGYTLLSVAVTFARVPAVVRAAGYDAAGDFTGVSLVCRIPQVLVVNHLHLGRPHVEVETVFAEVSITQPKTVVRLGTGIGPMDCSVVLLSGSSSMSKKLLSL